MGQKGLGANSTAEEAGGDIRLDERVAIVTGANSGIGKETARVLVKMGAYVVLACRDVDKANDVLEWIKNDTGIEDNAVVIPLDLGSFASIKNFVSEFHEKNLPLHILINNAGVMATPERTTEDGLEYQMGINHFGHFLLTYLLLDDIKKSAPARIVNVSSMAHRNGKISFENIHLQNGEYGSWKAYGQSKLANILFTKALARKFEEEGVNVTANSLHPGVIATDLFRDMAWAAPFISFAANLNICKDIPRGAATTIFVATSPDLDGHWKIFF